MIKRFKTASDRNSGKNAQQVAPTASAAATLPSIPLYAAGAVVQSAGLAAVAFQLGDLIFAVFTIGLTFAGCLASYLMRRGGTPTRLLKSGTLLLGLIFLYSLRSAGIFGLLVSPEEAGSQEMLLVSALAFTATFSSFLLLTDDAVIFTCVWTIAMIGLTGTVNINSDLPICFVVFLAAASFLLVHQNALAFGGNGGESPETASEKTATPGVQPHFLRFQWPLLRTHLVTAMAAWFMSLFLGTLIAIPVQMAGRSMSLATVLGRFKVPPSPASHSGSGLQRLVFDGKAEFNVGLGPVDDDPTERMSVWSDRPEYWRGRTYEDYQERKWSTQFAERPAMIPANTNTLDRSGNYSYNLQSFYNNEEPRRRTERITNTFHVSSGTYGPMYHAAEPKIIRLPLSGIYFRGDHTLSGGRGVNIDYEVESDVSVARPSDLRQSSIIYPPEIGAMYLSVGSYGYSDALHDLTQQAIAGMAGNPYDKASAIRRFIAARCTYTRDAPAVPQDRDAAEYFLNESHQGYCDLYATSMAILCRYAGLPSRVVTGFAPGYEVPDDTEPKPGGASDKRKRYLLRGSDQHAWTEVYFTGYGWIVFDATIDTGGVAPTRQTPEPVENRTPFAKSWPRLLALALAGLGALSFAFAAFTELRGRSSRSKSERGFPAMQRDIESIYQTYQSAVRRLRRWGIRREATATTGEYLTAVHEVLGPDPGEALKLLTLLTEKALYGPSSVTPEDAAEAKKTRAALDVWLKQIPRNIARQRERMKNDAASPR